MALPVLGDESQVESQVTNVNVRSVRVDRMEKERPFGPAIAVALVPIKVRLGGSSRVTIYVAQDPYSTDSFIREDLASKLGVIGQPVQISLTTMGRDQSRFSTQVVRGLEVIDLDETNVIQLPPTFTHRNLPVSREDIPFRSQVEAWDHLKDIPIQYTEAGVGILIGMNSPEALRPLDIVASKDHEPYGVRTKLGWTIHGPLGASTINQK